MAFDDLSLIPEALEVTRLDIIPSPPPLQHYCLHLHDPSTGDSWQLRVDEFEWRNEIVLKRNYALVYVQDIRMNVYAPMVALLTGLPLKSLLGDESLVPKHLESLGMPMARIGAWQATGVPANEAAARIKAVLEGSV